MTNPLADIDNICFVDTETRALKSASLSDGNLKTAGTYRYAKNSFVIVSTFAIGDGPVFEVSLDRGFDGDWLCWDEMPHSLREFHKRVEQREAWYGAWNMGFDRNAWNEGTYDFPRLAVDQTVDIMAQGVASNLAPSLEGAARGLRIDGKQSDGKALIAMFCSRDGETPQSRPVEWQRFKGYGLQDTHVLREVFRATRALPFEEWEDYWVSEKINDRGVAIDLPLVERAALVSQADIARSNALLNRWTNGQVTAVTQVAKLADWIYDRLEYTEARMLLVSGFDEDASAEDDETGDLKVGKLSLERSRIEAVLAFFATLSEREGGLSERDQVIVDVLTVRQFGGSASPQKFAKMTAQHDGGRLKGQYVFNGAQQTGRYSSKGVQTHNLTRSSLGPFEAAAIEMINDLEV